VYVLELQTWQQAVIVLAVALSVGWMSLVIARLFSRRAACAAEEREATAFESALVGAAVPAQTAAFDGWSYRVGARYAGRVRILVMRDCVAVAGPRVPRAVYRAWIWSQGLLLALVVPTAVAALVTFDARWLAATAAFAALSWIISMGGAGLWPGLGELGSVETGRFQALEFPRRCVNQVDVGAGWAKGGLEVVLLPYKAAVDSMAKGRAVSFFAPDEAGREARFAVHMYSEQDAASLAGLLSEQPAGR
jgi:hypothetical protein